jgi:hypothetical protein
MSKKEKNNKLQGSFHLINISNSLDVVVVNFNNSEEIINTNQKEMATDRIQIKIKVKPDILDKMNLIYDKKVFRKYGDKRNHSSMVISKSRFLEFVIREYLEEPLNKVFLEKLKILAEKKNK